MKLDAEVIITNVPHELNSVLKPEQKLTITVDKDYCNDGDDVISWVESELYRKFNVSLFNTENFEITNYYDICETIYS